MIALDHVQIGVAVLLALCGLLLLFMGISIEPPGKIDPSVLAAYGEVSTFSATLFGIDYKRRKGGKDESKRD